MAISPHLHRKLQETLGADAADDLVVILEGMESNRGDIGELRHEMQLGFARMDARFERLESRFQAFDERFGSTRFEFQATLERGLRDQTRFFFLAWSVLLAAIVGLYAR